MDFRSLKNLNRDVVVCVLMFVHHVRSGHSNLVFNFGFDVAQIVRVFLDSVSLVVHSVLAILNAGGRSFCDIFGVFLRLGLYVYWLSGLILISL